MMIELHPIPATVGELQTEAYWDGLAKRSLCRFFLLSHLARGPLHGYALNQAIRDACQGCCKPTETMVYATMRELQQGGYVTCRDEMHGARPRRVCQLTPAGVEAYRAAARVWQRVFPQIQQAVATALEPLERSAVSNQRSGDAENG